MYRAEIICNICNMEVQRQFSRFNFMHLMLLPKLDEVDVRKKQQCNVCSVYKYHRALGFR